MTYRIRYEYGVWCVRTEKGWLLGSGFDIPDACRKAREQVQFLYGAGWLE